ncbi:hypothetical protein B0H19DRAFT_1275690 [Mycena capillaripes]|nr:hypothetical protein B0H19DRAFT_1275690 [Mycena capillaripes]
MHLRHPPLLAPRSSSTYTSSLPAPRFPAICRLTAPPLCNLKSSIAANPSTSRDSCTSISLPWPRQQWRERPRLAADSDVVIDTQRADVQAVAPNCLDCRFYRQYESMSTSRKGGTGGRGAEGWRACILRPLQDKALFVFPQVDAHSPTGVPGIGRNVSAPPAAVTLAPDASAVVATSAIRFSPLTGATPSSHTSSLAPLSHTSTPPPLASLSTLHPLALSSPAACATGGLCFVPPSPAPMPASALRRVYPVPAIGSAHLRRP